MSALSLDTKVGEYLKVCEAEGANADGICYAYQWVEERGLSDATMRMALPQMPEQVARESAIFALRVMLDSLSPSLREQFIEVIKAGPSDALRVFFLRELRGLSQKEREALSVRITKPHKKLGKKEVG